MIEAHPSQSVAVRRSPSHSVAVRRSERWSSHRIPAPTTAETGSRDPGSWPRIGETEVRSHRGASRGDGGRVRAPRQRGPASASSRTGWAPTREGVALKSRNRSVDDALACRCGTTIASAASQGRGWVLGVSIESPKRLRPALPDRHTSGHQCPWPDGTLSPPQISAGHPGGALAASPQEAWALASCRKETYAIVITQQTQDKTKSGIILYICINTVRRRSARRACSAFASSRFAFCLIFFCRHKRG